MLRERSEPIDHQEMHRLALLLQAARAKKRERFRLSDYLFWLMMLTVNIPNVLEIWDIDTIFKPYRMLSLVLATLAIPTVLTESHRTRRYSLPMGVAIAWIGIVTVLFAGSDTYEVAPILISSVCLFFATYGVTSRRSLFIGLFCSVISYGISAGWGALQWTRGEYRLEGLFSNPNALGLASCFAVIIASNRFFRIPNTLKIFVWIASSIIVVWTGSRGATLAMLGSITTQSWRQPKILASLVVVGGIVVAAGSVMDDRVSGVMEEYPSLFARFSGERINDGGRGRLAIMQAAFEVAYENYFIGIGLDQFRLKYYTRYFRHRGQDGEIQQLGTHNVYMSLLCEWGIIGFSCFAVIYYRLVKDSRSLLAERDWILGFCIATLLMGFSTDLITNVSFWVMLGSSVQLIRFADSGKSRTPAEHVKNPI